MVLNNEMSLEKAHKIYFRDWFKKVPAVLLICANLKRGCVRKDGAIHAKIDTTLFIDHMNLAATEFGLAT